MVSRYDARRLPRRCRGALQKIVEHGTLRKGGPQRWYAGDENVCSTQTIKELEAGGLIQAPRNVAIVTPRGLEMFEILKDFTPHTCHARGCTMECKPEHLMCGGHWRMVSRVNQNAVYDAYRSGQCEGEPPPSASWHRAADIAINEVARKEGLPEKPLDEEFYRHLEERDG